MPRISRHKSHKQSKHSSKDARDYSDSEEDVKMKGRISKEDGSVRVSKDSASGEKRKLVPQSRDGKDLSVNVNGDASEDYVSSKRRKEKAVGSGGDRWNGGGDERGHGATVNKEIKGESSRIDLDKGSKSKESKVEIETKSKSRRHDSGGGEKKEESGGLVAEKEESKSGSRVDSKGKSEKDTGRKEGHQYKDTKELKEKDRGLDRERKIQDNKRNVEVRIVDGEEKRKQGLVDIGDGSHRKRGRENTEGTIQDELRNLELEKELEKRIRRRRDGSTDKDKYQGDVRESDDRLLSSRTERSKDVRYKDERHKDGSYRDRHWEDGDKDDRHRDDRFREDGEKDNRHRDVKYRGDGERDNRRKDDKYREEGDRDNRCIRDDKHHEDSERDNRRRDDKYHEDGDRDSKHRDKYREDGDRDNRRGDNRCREDRERDDRPKDDKYKEDCDRDTRHKEEKHQEDVGRDSRFRDGKQGDDIDREKRIRDVKYRDERASRERSTDKSDTKRLRDESSAGDIYHRKSNNRDGSPTHDDRSTRYKDEQGKRRAYDKEDHSDIRSRSTKEQRSDAERRYMTGAKSELVTDRGRSNSRNADLEFTLNQSRRRSSPSSSSHAARDYYRISKQEESRYRDYSYEERARLNLTSSREYVGTAGVAEKISSPRSVEKHIQKDDSYLGVLSAERRPKSDARNSPLQLVDKSPSSTSTERRHLNRSDVRRSLDVEESGRRSGGSKDAKDYSGKEGRGSRELPMERFPVDELSQADGDTLSVSSPFPRTSHFSANSKSLLPPPPPFRTGVDSPVVFGSSEDENRGKSHNRYGRIGDNMGRVQGSSWKGVPNWPPPLGNGFMPFQHGPPIGFHPTMQQYPAPPIFGVRPSMELNHTGIPYHIPDADRFSGHGRSLGWRNPMDNSCPPPLHGWDANNAVFGDDTHIYGRLDWDHNRSLPSSRRWETSRDMWKGQNSVVSADFPSAPQKGDYSAHGPADEVWADQFGQKDQNEQNQPDLQAGSNDVSQSSDTFERNTPEIPKTVPEETPNDSKISEKNDAHLCHVYLSKLDISADLTQPELYNHCTSLTNMDQSTIYDEDSKILYVEEAIKAKVTVPRTSSASLFAAINDTIFQKAMSLYKKQREDIGVINGKEVSFSTLEDPEFVPTSVQEEAAPNDGKQEDLAPARDQQEAESADPNSNKKDAELPVSSRMIGGLPAAASQKLDEQELVPTLNSVKVEDDLVPVQKKVEYIVEDKSLAPENVEGADACLLHLSEDEANRCSNFGVHYSANNNEEQNLLDNKCGSLLFSDVPSEAFEAVMPESFESALVNLSRIHHSPESTH